MSSILVNPDGSGTPAPQPLSPVSPELPVANLGLMLEEVDSAPFAHGGYSFVYKYRTRRHTAESSNAIDKLYAVKALKYSSNDPNLERWNKRLNREINAWILLKHSNVLELHGVLYRSDSPMPCLVSDFMENGTSAAYIRNTPESNLIRILRGMASGLSYLHNQNIVHGDIKADNILVNRFGEACVGDFGLSRILKLDGSTTITTTDGNRASRWTAFEFLDFTTGPTAPTKKGDVWSFGCTALELFSGKFPYFNVRMDTQVVFCLGNKQLPEIPSFGSLLRNDFEKHREGITALCSLCWIIDHVCRPNMDTIASIVNSFCLKGGSCGIANTESPNLNRNGDQNALDSTHLPARANTGGIAMSRTFIPRRENVTRSASESTITASNFKSQQPECFEQQINTDYPQSPVSPVLAPSNVDSIDSPTNQSDESEVDSITATAPWSAMHPPPASTVESILRRLGKSANVFLNEHCQKNGARLTYKYGLPMGTAHAPIFSTICLVQEEVYGNGTSEGAKKRSKELASLHALERMYRENPSHFPTLRYFPLLRTHLEDYTGFEWSPPSAPLVNDQNLPVHTVTLSLKGVILGVGLGQTRDEAQEQAARNAADVWRGGIN